eukprot:scaffold34804_cov58-Phaeocystis_antarctica.AAC.6
MTHEGVSRASMRARENAREGWRGACELCHRLLQSCRAEKADCSMVPCSPLSQTWRGRATGRYGLLADKGCWAGGCANP